MTIVLSICNPMQLNLSVILLNRILFEQLFSFCSQVADTHVQILWPNRRHKHSHWFWLIHPLLKKLFLSHKKVFEFLFSRARCFDIFFSGEGLLRFIFPWGRPFEIIFFLETGLQFFFLDFLHLPHPLWSSP